MGEEKQIGGDNATGTEKGTFKVPQDTGAGLPPRKVQKHNGEGEGGDENMEDEQYQEAITEIDKAQNELDVLTDKSSSEILAVEQKYNQLRKPVIQKRHESIAKIPNFWLVALRNHPLLSMIIDEEEEECLQYLSKIHVEEADDIKSGYKIEFHFNPNPFFENDVLVKECSSDSSAPFGNTSKSNDIRWKPGMDLVKRLGKITISSRKRKHEDSSSTASFFGWFVKQTSADMDKIREAFMEELWLNPLNYYYANPEDEDESDVDEEVEMGEEDLGEDDDSAHSAILDEEEEIRVEGDDDEDV